SVANGAHPLIFKVPLSQFLAQFNIVVIQWPWIKFPIPCKLLEGADPCQPSEPTHPLNRTTQQVQRASQLFEPYLDLLENQSPSCLINNWDQFEQQLFTLFGDPNEVRNTEYELNSLSMKDNGKASTYIAQFRTLQSRVNWNNAAFAFHFRKGLPSRITDQLALTGQQLKTLQQLIDRTIELDNCYHEKNEDALRYKPLKKFSSKPSTPFTSSSASRPTEIALVLNKESQLNRDERARREKEGLCLYCG
ncbi:uncharacterized protein VP01_7844g1, partial [Puccinia sorghi]